MPRKTPATDPVAGQRSEHVAVASIAATSPEDVEALRSQIADLEAQLDLARSDKELQALAVAEAQFRDMQEVPTGKTVTVQRCRGYKTVSYRDDGRPILKPLWEDEEVPTFFYKIDIPPVGGAGLIPNGTPFYHATVYEVDIHTLRSWKDQVYRLWAHERNINGSNENAYRRESAPTLSARGM